MNTANTIKRRTYDKGFTVVANDFLRDASLSWKAKGIVAYVCMLPDDWTLNVRDLITRSNDGRDSVYSGLRELEARGYCKREQVRNADGTLAGYAYEVSDRPDFAGNDTAGAVEPTEKPYTEKPYTEKPYTEKPYTEKPYTATLYKKENKDNNKETDKENKEERESQSLATALAIFSFEKMLFRDSIIMKNVNDTGSVEEVQALCPEYPTADMVYYVGAVDNWSMRKGIKNTAQGWLETIKYFIRSDAEKNVLHTRKVYRCKETPARPALTPEQTAKYNAEIKARNAEIFQTFKDTGTLQMSLIEERLCFGELVEQGKIQPDGDVPRREQIRKAFEKIINEM